MVQTQRWRQWLLDGSAGLLILVLTLAAGRRFSTPPPSSAPAPVAQQAAQQAVASAAEPDAPRAQDGNAPAANARHVWGNAVNSAAEDGAHFFDPAAARDFLAGTAPDDKKYVVELHARAFLPQSVKLKDGRALEGIFGPEQPGGERWAYLQFVDHPTEAQRAELAGQGVQLIGYVSAYAWTARGTEDAFGAALGRKEVRAVARIDARDKLQSQVFSGQTPAWALADDGRTRFAVLAPPHTTAEVFAEKIKAAPGLAAATLLPAAPSVLGPRFEVRAAPGDARAIAALDVTAFVEFVAPPAVSRDATTDSQSNVNDVRDSAPSLSGSGVKVAVREIGKPDLHADFSSRLTYVDSDGALTSDKNHATEVCGQIASDGGTQPAAKGTAPAVSLLVYSLQDSAFGTTDVINAAGQSARISNHSYGPTGSPVGDYQSISADWDTAIRDNNLLGFFANYEASGGPGYKKVDYFVGAKNTICISATSATAHAGDDSPVTAKSDGIASFSAYGPMADGRVKPDLVSFGESVTLDIGTNSTTTNSGTSFSTPAATGIGALVFQHYKSKTGSEPSAALTKALLCNSATDLGQTGPDAVYGFGIINAEAAIGTINLIQSASVGPFYESSVVNGGTSTFSINVQAASQLKVTLVWMDLPGTPAAAKALVNNLDLELVAPDGTTTVLPYSLDAANPSAAATNTAANTVDPIEQAVVDAPQLGVWTVVIKGASIPSGSQAFAVCFNKPSQPLPLTPVILASPTQGEAPLGAYFSGAASSGGILTYTWDFGDGSAAAIGSEVSHTFATLGTFTVTLTITSSDSTQSTSTTITTIKKAVSAFGSKARGNLNFQRAGRDSLQLKMVVPELVQTQQQARQTVIDRTLAGASYTVRAGGTGIAAFETDARGNAKSASQTFKQNLTRGELNVSIKGGTAIREIFRALGMDETTTSSGFHDLPVEIETVDAVYSATFRLLYSNRNGKTGVGKTL
jgi:PKD repeat protein